MAGDTARQNRKHRGHNKAHAVAGKQQSVTRMEQVQGPDNRPALRGSKQPSNTLAAQDSSAQAQRGAQQPAGEKHGSGYTQRPGSASTEQRHKARRRAQTAPKTQACGRMAQTAQGGTTAQVRLHGSSIRSGQPQAGGPSPNTVTRKTLNGAHTPRFSGWWG